MGESKAATSLGSPMGATYSFNLQPVIRTCQQPSLVRIICGWSQLLRIATVISKQEETGRGQILQTQESGWEAGVKLGS